VGCSRSRAERFRAAQFRAAQFRAARFSAAVDAELSRYEATPGTGKLWSPHLPLKIDPRVML